MGNWRHGHKSGSWRSREYGCWTNMKTRCFNRNCRFYPDYGGRGISVCERWMKFENFLEDMGHCPSPKHSIDRIDNDKGYEPGNCRWATKTQQSRNRDGYVIRVRVNGREMCLTEACLELGLKYDTVKRRVQRGWSPVMALYG